MENDLAAALPGIMVSVPYSLVQMPQRADRNELLERLLEIGKAVLAERDVDRVLTRALDGLIELCGAERGMVLLFDPEGEAVFEQARNIGQSDIEDPEFEVSRTILERVREEGEPFWSENVLDDATISDRTSVIRLSILSVICHPIRHEGRTFGVVYLDNRSVRGMFTGEVAALVATFSDFISLAAHGALERRRLHQKIDALSEQLRERYDFSAIVGQDPAMVRVLRLVAQVADSEATVLVTGESGTGKELVARALHANSRRRARPFVPVNCGALPESLLESELFGHVRGAFTGAVQDNPGWFERAQGGTLFLDEVGELSPALQVKLLRILENGEYARVGSTQVRRADARIVAATNRDLGRLVQAGKVREDFLYRLKVIEVELPPLRERRSDVPLLVRHLLARLNERHGGGKRLSRAAEELLCLHDWPGNVRELSNVLQRAVLLSEGETIEPEDLPETIAGRATGAAAGGAANGGEPAPPGGFREAKRRAVERFERDYLERCLRLAEGNISRAARAAGIDYKNFYVKLQRYGIDARSPSR